MGTMEEVIERLHDTEKKAGEVIRQLEEAESIHKSIDKTRKGLETQSREVKKLMTTTRKAVDGLSEAVTAFKIATETIQQSDPALITAMLETMQTQIKTIASEVSTITEIKADVGALAETVTQTGSVNKDRMEAIASEVSAIAEVKAEVTALKETVAQTASVNEERTRAMIDNAVDEVSGQSLMDRVLGTRRNAKAKRNT